MKISRGTLYGIGAYTLWGLLPIYWKALKTVPAPEILANRMVWTLVFVAALLTFRRHWRWLRPSLHERRLILTYLATATLLAVNWLTYIWAVNAGYIIETSLGYFINPLINVLLGLLFLHERLRGAQMVALLLAAGGVLYLTAVYGSFPWIAITLALSFGFYGLLRKTGSLDSTEGLTFETAVYFIPALAYLLVLNANGTGSFAGGDPRITLLLVGTGLVTGIPLLLFGAAAKRITLTNLGLLQYIAPTMQFLLGLFVYDEPFNRSQLLGFVFIWLALIIYTLEGVRHSRYKNGAAKLKDVPAAVD
ncbi:MAG: EamA family transporter RarD [Candidatus Promineifilaceae bacterium]|jgi:chloramphenicol-sensitive protein RarD